MSTTAARLWPHSGHRPRPGRTKAGTAGAKAVTPLGAAARAGCLDAVTLLVEAHGAAVNGAAAGSRYTPLGLAIYARKEAVALWLLARGADARTANRWGETPLASAAARGASPQLLVALARAAGDGCSGGGGGGGVDSAIDDDGGVDEDAAAVDAGGRFSIRRAARGDREALRALFIASQEALAAEGAACADDADACAAAAAEAAAHAEQRAC
jgi:hypothetical protein